MYLLLNSNTLILLLKTNGGKTEGLILLFCSSECFNCRWGWHGAESLV